MKRFFGMGLVVLTLAVIAAQCGAVVADPADDTSNQAVEGTSVEQATPEEETALEEENVAESSKEVVEEKTTAVEETAAKTEAIEKEAVAEVSAQSATCDDPFADAGSLRFSPRPWTAEQIARFVTPGLVDPASGLETDFCLHSIDYSEILSGGPPPDGIPPIDNPTFDSIATGDEWLADVQPVISLAVGDEARAYPLAILTRHEIVNDEIGGISVAVTFCPLCNTGVVYNREVNGEILRFGVSGNLHNSDLIMWDNKTLSWWQQFTGEAIVGQMTGTQLQIIPAQMVAWKDFKTAFPDGVVLSTNGRSYGQNPYVGYDSSPRPFLYAGTPDPRLPALERVLGFTSGETAVAYPMPVIAKEGVIEDNIVGQDVVVFFEPGQVSALDQGDIESSKEVGSAAMFIPSIDGQKLTFSYDNGLITDNETGSEWNIFGRAVRGELAGSQLEPLQGRVDFWFAWAAFEPDTTLYGS